MPVINFFSSVTGKLFNFRVIVFGQHSRDWNTALAPEAQVWKLIPGVKGVVVACNEKPLPGLSWIGRLFTVVIPLLEDHISACPAGHRALIPDKKSLHILRNKANFADYTKAAGLTGLCPQMYPDGKRAVYPCVLKRTDMNAGNGVAIVFSADHLQDLLSQKMWYQKPYILQEYIPGRDYVTHMVCKSGKILWHHSYQYDHFDLQIRRGPSTGREITVSSSLLGQFEKFLQPLSFTGPCNFDYKFSPDGRLKVLEINPRLGGSLMAPERVEALKAALTCIIKQTRWIPVRQRGYL